MGAVAIQDVAEHAGVSRATVSRVLNNPSIVSPELRMRVLRAIDELGYQPNRAARQLRSSANISTVLGLIISDIENPFFISIVRGVEDVAYANRMNVILCNTDENPAKQRMYLDVMMAERAGGLIISLAPGTDPGELDQLRKNGTPIVLLDRRVQDYDFDSVHVDNVQGAFMAINHLIALGHQRIAIIGGISELTTARERYEGYCKALEAAGLPLEKALVKQGNYKADGGYQLTMQLMSVDDPPDAIFTANNLMTLGALRALNEMGMRVPQDVALVGFDDMPWSGQLCPPLTAVSQPSYDMGQEAARLALRRLQRPNASTTSVMLHTELIVRESCGARL